MQLKNGSVNSSADDIALADRTKLLDLANVESPEFTTVKHSLHNGVRHMFYCACLTCRQCVFCSHPPTKNKAGCLTHYGLVHPQMKTFWKPGF